MPHSILCLLFALLPFTFTYPQSNPLTRPEPGSAIVSPQIEEESPPTSPTEHTPPDPEAAKAALLRIWAYLPPSENTAYALALESIPNPASPSPEPFLWLYRGLSSFDARDYLTIPPGSYRILIFSETPQPQSNDPETLQKELDAWFARPSDERLLYRSPQPIQLTKKQRTFLLLTQTHNQWQLREIPQPSPNSKSLLMLNLQSQPVSVEFTLPDGSIVSKAAQNLTAEPTIASVPPKAKWLLVTVRFTNPNGAPMQRNHECDFSSTPNPTLAIFTDRYGRLSTRLFPD